MFINNRTISALILPIVMANSPVSDWQNYDSDKAVFAIINGKIPKC